MKNILLKIALFAIILSLQSNYLLAQSFQLLKPVSVPEVLEGLKEDYDITSSPEVKNISAATIKTKVSITPIVIISGHLFSFCDIGGCYMPSNKYLESPLPFDIKAGETTESNVHIYLHPEGVDGVSILEVTFFNADNPDDAVSYQVTYKVGLVDVNEPQLVTFNLADIVPNPAKDNVKIKLNNINNQAGLISIYDINSRIIEQQNTVESQEFLLINTSNYLAGTYFYNFSTNGKILKTGKFQVIK